MLGELTIKLKKIGKLHYGASRCVVTLGGAEIPAYAVVCVGKLGRVQKWICTYVDCAMRLIEWGLSHQQAKELLDSVAPKADRVELKQITHGEPE